MLVHTLGVRTVLLLRAFQQHDDYCAGMKYTVIQAICVTSIIHNMLALMYEDSMSGSSF